MPGSTTPQASHLNSRVTRKAFLVARQAREKYFSRLGFLAGGDFIK
jgi:hypothetical protein